MNWFKSVLICVLIVLSFFSIYYGAYKPLTKSQLYIKANSVASGFQTFNDLTETYDQVFNFPSPIGQQEIVKFFTNNVLSIIAQKSISEEIAVELVKYAESKIFKDNVNHLLHMAYTYDYLWQRFEDEEYLKKSEEYYNQINKIGPKLPHSLYGLFNLYKKAGQTEKMKEIGGKILELWPEDNGIKKIVDSFKNI